MFLAATVSSKDTENKSEAIKAPLIPEISLANKKSTLMVRTDSRA